MVTNPTGMMVAGLVFLTTLQIGFCLNCYVCVSANRHEKCNDPFDKSNRTADICDNPTDVCVKEKLHPIGSLSVNLRRGCSTSDYCKTLGAKSPHCSTCDMDSCNIAVIEMPSIGLWFSVIIGMILIISS